VKTIAPLRISPFPIFPEASTLNAVVRDAFASSNGADARPARAGANAETPLKRRRSDPVIANFSNASLGGRSRKPQQTCSNSLRPFGVGDKPSPPVVDIPPALRVEADRSEASNFPESPRATSRKICEVVASNAFEAGDPSVAV
jgi:hypothetical protein